MKKHQLISIIVFFLCTYENSVFGQTFELPDIPEYDSIYVDSYNGKIKEKTYFLKGSRVFEVGYNTGSMLYTPFSHIGGGKEDSCYAYFNGVNHDQYNFYYISKDYIINRRYAEDSKVFKYRKFDWNNVPIENGNYYFIKEMYESTISHYSKYKIGKWTKYDSSGNPTEEIDYDNFTINDKPINFIKSLSIIDSLKTLADNRIIEIYGKKFYSKYVRFNLDQSGYYTYKKPRPEQPGGYSLLKQTEKEIYFVDLSYDLIIGDERFNSIQFRVSKTGDFLGRTHFPSFAKKYFYLNQGLDSLNNRRFHKNLLNWRNIAIENEFDPTNADFNVKIEFSPTSDFYGELRMVLEQISETSSTKYSFTNKLKQLYINPWTGEVKESVDEQGTESIMIDE